uniref:non-specific serine/threonine protein kinase n=1 Tax=Nelumbo nucifera TaxID=4432 RepID=A0A822XX07_NELNU|nr:TPA_asm: hypothetical protein HUJ06_027631 [Nelumbo nucifera]
MKFSLSFLVCFSSAHEDNVDYSKQGLQSPPNVHHYSYKELKDATQGFRPLNKIGEGGFGSVYKGRLQDGTLVAVKVLSAESNQGEREFMAEIAAMSNVRHENLATLLGGCVDGSNRILVYEYMENNSVAHMLLGGEHNRVMLNWDVRRKICLGVARGLAYLHEVLRPHIVHRDVKARNILLDADFTPKVSDFGLSKLFSDDVTHVTTRVAGTFFGVLLMEIVSGRPVVDFNLEHGEHNLADKAWGMYQANELLQLIDPSLKGEFPEEEAIRFLKVGLLCVQDDPKLRPHMSKAYKMMCNEIDVKNFEISPPGLLMDLDNVKVGGKNTSNTSSGTSKGSTATSSSSWGSHSATLIE